MNFFPILLKDSLRAFRNVFGVAMTFVTPLLITLIIAFAFGGFTRPEDGQVQIQAVSVAAVNLDESSQGFSAGEQFLQFLQSRDLQDILQVQIMPGETEALAAVQEGNAVAALVIPAGFSQAVLSGASRAEVMLTSDPALTIGPSIVQSVVGSFIDSYNGVAASRQVVETQLAARGIPADPGLTARVMTAYGAWANETAGTALTIQAPPAPPEANRGMGRVFSLIMAGQMVFFAFWTAANNSASLLRESEEGTLARLFTTPVNRRTVLAAKFSMVAVFVLVQVLVLVGISRLALNLYWGSLPAVAMAALGLVISAGGFGIFIISLLKNTRQEGAVLGGLLTVMGMLSGLFTVGFNSVPAAFNLGSYFTPHGWAMRLWKLAVDGAALDQMAVPLLVCLAIGMAFFAAGYYRFEKRFS